jgi:hypothetical protein
VGGWVRGGGNEARPWTCYQDAVFTEWDSSVVLLDPPVGRQQHPPSCCPVASTDFCWRHRPASMVVQVPTGFDQQKCLRGRVGGESLGAHPARLDSVPDFLVRWGGLLLMEVLPWALHHCWDRMPPRTRMPAAHGSCCSCHPSCPLSPPESDSLQPCTLLPKGPWLVPQRCYIVTLVSVA